MGEITTDPNDPRLNKGKPGQQNDVYLVLSEEERRLGFVRPVRRSYIHVGKRPVHPLRDLTPEEQERFKGDGYVKFEVYPESKLPATGRYWTEAELNSGCGTETSMSIELAETYARDPKFYGATWCCHCKTHPRVNEFVWVGTDERVGS